MTRSIEEAPDRGVVQRLLAPSGIGRAIWLGSALFGASHLTNVLFRPSVGLVLSQAFGAFCFGVGYASLADQRDLAAHGAARGVAQRQPPDACPVGEPLKVLALVLVHDALPRCSRLLAHRRADVVDEVPAGARTLPQRDMGRPRPDPAGRHHRRDRARLARAGAALDDVDSGDIDLAGRFAELVDRLGTVLRDLASKHPVEHWNATLLARWTP